MHTYYLLKLITYNIIYYMYIFKNMKVFYLDVSFDAYFGEPQCGGFYPSKI